MINVCADNLDAVLQKDTLSGWDELQQLIKLINTPVEELPLLINEKMSPGIHEVYKRAVSREKPLSPFNVMRYPMDPAYYVYECPPLDFWDLWNVITVSDLAYRRELLIFVRNAMLLFRKFTYWESDIRIGPAIAPVPTGDSECTPVIAIKHDNNGDTYFCCKVPLPIDKEYLRHQP
jgi:hypothetical protein